MKYEYKTHAAYRGYGWIEPLTDSEDSLIEDYLARRICEELNTLQAEVEALREKVKQHEVVFKVQAEALKSTREQVQRVRSACNRIIENAQRFDLDDEHGLVYGQWMTAKSILRALDGDA